MCVFFIAGEVAYIRIREDSSEGSGGGYEDRERARGSPRDR